MSHWIIPFKSHEILFSCLIFFLQNYERTTTSIKKVSIYPESCSSICTQTALNWVQFLYSRLIFIHGVQQQLNVSQKETQIINTLESKMGIDKNRNRKAESELIKFKAYPTLHLFSLKKASNTSFLFFYSISLAFSILFLIYFLFYSFSFYYMYVYINKKQPNVYCVRLTETCHSTCLLLFFCWFWLLLLSLFVSRFG